MRIKNFELGQGLVVRAGLCPFFELDRMDRIEQDGFIEN
jgi:hypothetical protein